MVAIRNAAPDDAGVLAYIQTQSWNAAFADILSSEDLRRFTDSSRIEAMYSRVLREPTIYTRIEYVDGRPHCIAVWGRNRGSMGETVAELICIHSLKDNWHQGCGSAMMAYILAEIKAAGFSDVILWVFEKNVRARKFYEKHGFCPTDQTQNSFGAAERMYKKEL